MKKMWFSIYDSSLSYKENEPEFFDSEQFEWAKEISKHTDIIHKELKTYTLENELPGYFNESMVEKKNTWRTIPLKTWSIEQNKNQQHFPKTIALINKYPEIISASFNLLEANSKIKPHCGDTNTIYRCHLGLDIPDGLPNCGFRVKDKLTAWEKGKWVIFTDANQHEAWNNTNQNRYIFLIDVIKPEFSQRKKYTCSTVMTSLFLQKRQGYFSFLGKSSPFLMKFMAKSLRPFAQFGIFWVNRIKKY